MRKYVFSPNHYITSLLLSLFALSALIAGCAKQPNAIPVGLGEQAGIRVLARYPHDSQAFTQGLVFDNGNFFESTGLYKQSSLRKVEPESGTVLLQVDLDKTYFAEGLTLLDGRLYQLTWQEQTGFIYDRDDFTLLGTFSYPYEGWGLTTDGDSLILSDGSATVYFLDPQNFQEKRSIQVMDGDKAVALLNELEYINGEIYANIWHSDTIVRIDPSNGNVLGWIDLSSLRIVEVAQGDENVLNGIAYDAVGGRLFVTGKFWPALYEIALINQLAP